MDKLSYCTCRARIQERALTVTLTGSFMRNRGIGMSSLISYLTTMPITSYPCQAKSRLCIHLSILHSVSSASQPSLCKQKVKPNRYSMPCLPEPIFPPNPFLPLPYPSLIPQSSLLQHAWEKRKGYVTTIHAPFQVKKTNVNKKSNAIGQ